jgi:hypothetical protein
MINSIETYVALNNPKDATIAVERMGAPKVTGHGDLVKKLHYATEKFGMKAFEKLAMIDTPYRKLILSQIEETKSGCGGCSGATGDQSSKELPKKEDTVVSDKHNPYMIAGVVLL